MKTGKDTHFMANTSGVMLLDEVEEVELGPNQGIMAALDATGDTKTIWDRTKPDEVEAARATFNTLKRKGYTGYRVKGSEGAKGEIMREFDPEAERMIMVPPMVGG